MPGDPPHREPPRDPSTRDPEGHRDPDGGRDPDPPLPPMPPAPGPDYHPGPGPDLPEPPPPLVLHPDNPGGTGGEPVTGPGDPGGSSGNRTDDASLVAALPPVKPDPLDKILAELNSLWGDDMPARPDPGNTPPLGSGMTPTELSAHLDRLIRELEETWGDASATPGSGGAIPDAGTGISSTSTTPNPPSNPPTTTSGQPATGHSPGAKSPAELALETFRSSFAAAAKEPIGIGTADPMHAAFNKGVAALVHAWATSVPPLHLHLAMPVSSHPDGAYFQDLKATSPISDPALSDAGRAAVGDFLRVAEGLLASWQQQRQNVVDGKAANMADLAHTLIMTILSHAEAYRKEVSAAGGNPSAYVSKIFSFANKIMADIRLVHASPGLAAVTWKLEYAGGAPQQYYVKTAASYHDALHSFWERAKSIQYIIMDDAAAKGIQSAMRKVQGSLADLLKEWHTSMGREKIKIDDIVKQSKKISDMIETYKSILKEYDNRATRDLIGVLSGIQLEMSRQLGARY